MHPVSKNILKYLDLGAYMGSHTDFALVSLQNFTHSRRQESTANPSELNTCHHKCEHTRELMDILQKEENGEKTWICYLPATAVSTLMKNNKKSSCKGPEQIFIHKILNQCKGQSTPFFQITAKFHFLLISHCLVPFPTAWVSFMYFCPQGGRDTIAPCYRQGWRNRERKDQAHLLWFSHPKVCHSSLNQWPQALRTCSDGKLHLIWKMDE